MIAIQRRTTWPLNPGQICLNTASNNNLIWAVVPVHMLNDYRIREAWSREMATNSKFGTRYGSHSALVRGSYLTEMPPRYTSWSELVEPASDDPTLTLPQAHTPIVPADTVPDEHPGDSHDLLRHIGSGHTDGVSTPNGRSVLSLSLTSGSQPDSQGSFVLPGTPTWTFFSLTRPYDGPIPSPPRSLRSLGFTTTPGHHTPHHNSSVDVDHLQPKHQLRQHGRSPLIHSTTVDESNLNNQQVDSTDFGDIQMTYTEMGTHEDPSQAQPIYTEPQQTDVLQNEGLQALQGSPQPIIDQPSLYQGQKRKQAPSSESSHTSVMPIQQTSHPLHKRARMKPESHHEEEDDEDENEDEVEDEDEDEDQKIE